MSEAHQFALTLMGRMNEVAQPGGPLPPGLTPFGVGQGDVMRRLAALEMRTRQTVRNLVPTLTFDPEDAAYELGERSMSRGVTLRLIVSPRTLRFHPLLTSFTPTALIGPVLFRTIIVDEHIAVIAGPDTVDGATTAWLATSGEFLESAVGLWHATVAESRPALPDGAEPPLNSRQLSVARALCLGRTDAAIARQLGISERSVARDVAAICDVTEAHSRSEAILNMLGRGRQSRT
ncbi:putative regulatory protein [Janibacter sp. HTCC2649]|uniref:response regulator transcription factor n=1 Tax=Janibacter sp. HTCC2649 TaxID=313589 RepID=UPI0000671966|nr:LuxR C-terminal-related transcriptional regulator [Janibacter sp. HTCC2649]EAP98186.1 putative regulatory protein [Janibacter sp. HTCC2649]